MLLLSQLGCGNSNAAGTAVTPKASAQASNTVSVGQDASPVMTSAERASAPKVSPGNGAATCKVMPLELRSNMTGKDVVLMALDAEGKISGGLLSLSGVTTNVRLDPRGCIVSDSAVWVERPSPDRLWTLRQWMDLEGEKVHITKRRWLTVDEQGRVFDKNGPQKSFMRFEGYQPEARCAAQLMLVAYLGMMPSMAVSDGNPKQLERPENSACPELHAVKKP